MHVVIDFVGQQIKIVIGIIYTNDFCFSWTYAATIFKVDDCMIVHEGPLFRKLHRKQKLYRNETKVTLRESGLNKSTRHSGLARGRDSNDGNIQHNQNSK